MNTEQLKIAEAHIAQGALQVQLIHSCIGLIAINKTDEAIVSLGKLAELITKTHTEYYKDET